MSDNPKEGLQELSRGLDFLRNEQWDAAIVCFREALNYLPDVIPSEDRARTFANLGVASWRKGEIEQAISYYLDALRYWPDVTPSKGKTRTIHNLGVASWQKGEVEQAISYYLDALRYWPDEIPSVDRADTLLGLGHALYDNEQIDQAIDCYQQALRHWPDMIPSEDRANTLCSLGSAYLATGNFPQAFDQVNRASTLITRGHHPKAFHTTLFIGGDILHRAGVHHGDSLLEHRGLRLLQEAALFAERHAATIGGETGRKFLASTLGPHLTLVRHFLSMGNLPIALHWLERSRARFLLQGMDLEAAASIDERFARSAREYRTLTDKLMNLHGEFCRNTQTDGDTLSPPDADRLEQLEEQRDVLVKRLFAVDPHNARILTRTPPNAREMADFLREQQAAYICLYVDEQNIRGLTACPGDDTLIFYCAQPLARCEFSTEDFVSLEKNRNANLHAIALWQEKFLMTREGVRTESGADLLTEAQCLIKGTIDLLYDTEYELCREECLRKRKEPVVKDWRDYVKDWRKLVDDWNKLVNECCPEDTDLFLQDAAALLDQAKGILTWCHRRDLEASTHRWQEFSRLAEEATIVSPSLREENNSILNDIAQAEQDQMLQAAGKLFTEAVQWLRKHAIGGKPITRLFISPHDFLHAIPLQAAILDPKDTLDKPLKTLGELFVLSHTPTLSQQIWLHEHRREADRKHVVCLAFSPENDPAFIPLPGASGQCRDTHELYGGVLLEEDSATAENLAAALAGADGMPYLAEFGCHGQNSGRPFIVLNDGNGGACEVHRDKLRTIIGEHAPEIAVLSACETGRNLAWREMEEYEALDAVFMEVLTPHIISGMLPLRDDTTRRIIARFHEHLRGGCPPAEALQAAQFEIRDGQVWDMGAAAAGETAAPRNRDRSNEPGGQQINSIAWASLRFSGLFE